MARCVASEPVEITVMPFCVPCTLAKVVSVTVMDCVPRFDFKTTPAKCVDAVIAWQELIVRGQNAAGIARREMYRSRVAGRHVVLRIACGDGNRIGYSGGKGRRQSAESERTDDRRDDDAALGADNGAGSHVGGSNALCSRCLELNTDKCVSSAIGSRERIVGRHDCGRIAAREVDGSSVVTSWLARRIESRDGYAKCVAGSGSFYGG